jgi:hypothetical protein
MSSKTHHSDPMPEMQEVDLNDAAWNEVVTTRLPATLEEQARQLKAWKRKREVRSVSDLLRALLVYACCQYSLGDTSHVGCTQRRWFALRAGVAQTAGPLPRVDCLVTA